MGSEGLLKSTVPFIMMGIYILLIFWLSMKTVTKKEKKAEGTIGGFENFYTGGRSMNAMTVALVTIVTFYSGTTFTGRVGFFYNFGVVALTSVFVSTFAGVVMYFLSEKIWPISQKYHLSTLPDLLEFRYQSKMVKAVTALIIICFNIVWLVSEVRTLGLIVNLASGDRISQAAGSAIMLMIVILYVCTGGVRSVAAVDSFSATIMTGASFIVLCAIVGRFFGGDPISIFLEGAAAAPELMTINAEGAYSYPYWISNIVLGSIVMFVYPSNYMSICMAKSVKAVKRSSLITALSGLWLVIYAVIAMAALGLNARGIMIHNPESALLEMVSYMNSSLLLGLVTTFILAASVGTLDSTLISLSALLSNDIIWNFWQIKKGAPCIGSDGYQGTLVEECSGKISKLSLTRIIVFLLGTTAYMLSLSRLPLLVILVNYAMSGMVQIIPTAVFGLYWKKSTPIAALVAMPVGVVSMLMLDYYANNIYFSADGKPFFGGFMVAIIALLLNAVIFIIISLVTKKKYDSEENALNKVCSVFFERRGGE